MNYLVPIDISSEISLRRELEDALDYIIIPEQLGEISFDSEVGEYREYTLISRTQYQGMDYGGIDDMMTVFHTWKFDKRDESFKIFLEYEQFDYSENGMVSTGISNEIGLVLKVSK